MKINVRFDAFDLREAVASAAMSFLAAGDEWPDAGQRFEDDARRRLGCWLDSSGEDSGRDRIAVEFDLEVGRARVLRRDGKVEIGGMLFTAAEAVGIRERATNISKATEALRGRVESGRGEGGAA